MHAGQLHSHARRPGGPAPRRSGQHGAARPGGAQGEVTSSKTSLFLAKEHQITAESGV